MWQQKGLSPYSPRLLHHKEISRELFFDAQYRKLFEFLLGAITKINDHREPNMYTYCSILV